MKYAQVHGLIRSHYQGDHRSFDAYTSQIASSLRDTAKRDELAKLAGAPRLQMLGDAAKLVAELPPRRLDSMVLDAHIRERVQLLLDEHASAVKLAEHGLHPRRRILLHGPPGNGKTTLAQAIATELGLNGYELTLSKARSSHMGESAKKLEQAMNVADNPGCLLLLDELDAIGDTRTHGEQSAAAKEGNATVSTILQRLNRPTRGYLVAATNRLDMVDAALVRRFDLVLEIPAPSRGALDVFTNIVFERLAWQRPDGWRANGESYATVESEVMDVVRSAIVRGGKS